ncbi:MAG TPA: glycosyltransferase family 39 protein [Pirellulales bacterium]
MLALACLVQAWMVVRAIVPAQDSIRYLTVAQAMARDGWLTAVRAQPEQPLFPSLVCLTHSVLSHTLGASSRHWVLSLQLVAAAAMVVCTVPVYFLFDRLHGRRAALLATLLFSVLGGVARLGADGLSDSTHLLFFCIALWTAAEYFTRFGRRPAAAWLFACGLSTGLALLARAEAVVLPLALWAALAASPFTRRCRQSWSMALSGAGALLLGLLPPLAIYLAACPGNHVDLAARLLGRGGAIESLPLNELSPSHAAADAEAKWNLPGVGRLVFGKKDFSASSRFRGGLPAAAKLVEELAQTLHYGLGALALAGLWFSRRRLNAPLDRFMQILCGALLLAALYVAADGGYLSTRHLLLLVVLALGWAAVGALTIGDWLVERVSRRPLMRFDVQDRKGLSRQRPPWRSAEGESALICSSRNTTEGVPYRRRWRVFPISNNKTRAVAWSVAALAMANCAGDLLRPLHASRAPHRQAAEWLQAHAAAGDAVLDSRGWTALYTGCKTYRYEAAQAAFCDRNLAYVVVEQAELESPSRRGETLRALVTEAGEPAVQFSSAQAAKHGVTIWRWHPERFAQLGVVSDAR